MKLPKNLDEILPSHIAAMTPEALETLGEQLESAGSSIDELKAVANKNDSRLSTSKTNRHIVANSLLQKDSRLKEFETEIKAKLEQLPLNVQSDMDALEKAADDVHNIIKGKNIEKFAAIKKIEGTSNLETLPGENMDKDKDKENEDEEGDANANDPVGEFKIGRNNYDATLNLKKNAIPKEHQRVNELTGKKDPTEVSVSLPRKTHDDLDKEFKEEDGFIRGGRV